MRGGGVSALLFGTAGLIVWAAHFLLIYGVQATLCAHGLAGQRVAGFGLVPVVVVASSLASLVVLAFIAVLAARRLRALPPSTEDAPRPAFSGGMALGTALFAALAVVWETIPALILPACG